MALLEVVNLHTQFLTPAGIVRAVDGVSFELEAGEVLGVVGESGSGKTVTALSMMRLIDPVSGRIGPGQVLLDGQDIMSMDARQLRAMRGAGMAMIFQDPMTSLNPLQRVGRQIAESLRLHLGMSRAAARKRAIDLLDRVGIADAARRVDDYPHQFSGGQRQRVMIAIAIACQPKVILADEMTTALDVTVQAQIVKLLRDLTAETGTSLVVITHDMGLVAGIADRIQVMYAGVIVERAATLAIFDVPQMPYTWGLLGSIPRPDRPRRERLVPIEGVPPDLIGGFGGCRFVTRCAYSRDVCVAHEPALLEAAGQESGHVRRCWGTQDVAGGGWLTRVDWRAEVGWT